MTEQFIAIFLMIIAIKSFFEAFNKAKPIDLDNVELFKIIESKPSCQVEINTSKPKRNSKPQPQPQPRPKVNESGYNSLQQDCYDALAALGVKTKKERTFLVNNTFNKHNPNTVQEFLQLCMVKPS